ncbi:Bgt-20533 [Blumeria graminis f. sp. tritici]|uniref:Bgt-20533 n=2 Tax=Blumeria graminis f. sp. tritici TaxID=62690 RepID=A0A381LBP3_BLUGR|nr:Bgt-20533 [Blumeria graminis f. sp. tritici]
MPNTDLLLLPYNFRTACHLSIGGAPLRQQSSTDQDPRVLHDDLTFPLLASLVS